MIDKFITTLEIRRSEITISKACFVIVHYVGNIFKYCQYCMKLSDHYELYVNVNTVVRLIICLPKQGK